MRNPGIAPGVRQKGKLSYERKRRRIKPAMPTSPVPSKPSVPGSGTVGGGFTGVDDVEKQVAKPPVVGSIPHAGPTRWIPRPVIVAPEALVKIRLTEENVPLAPLPVVWKHRVSAFIPPHDPVPMVPVPV